MKKYIGIIIFAIAIIGIILSGVFMRGRKSVSDVTDASTTEAMQTSDEGTEEVTTGEEEYFLQIQEDADAAEKQNIFTIQDGKQSYGGFEYEVKNFAIFDSFDEFRADDTYDESYLLFDPDEEKMAVVYIELEVTNASETATEVFHPANLRVAYADQAGEVRNMASEVFYSSPAENPSDEKNPNDPKLKPGASDTLQIAVGCMCYTDNGEMIAYSKLYDGVWYLVIPGASYAHTEPPYSIYDDFQHIFIRLE